jgi:predicted ester cyclase/ketosteroid isomerase-like protein
MSIESNKDLVQRFLEGMWNYEKLVSLEQFLAPEYVFHGATGDVIGAAAYRSAQAAEQESIADLLIKVDEMIAEGDRVVARYTSWFTPHGEFMGAFPTGKPMMMQCVSVHRVADGKIVESWETYDRRSRLRDLGLEQNLGDPDRDVIKNVVTAALKNGLRDLERHVHDYYSEGAEVVAANGTSMRGRRAILDWFKRFPEISEWKLEDIEIDGAGEVAYVRGRYTMILSGRAKLPFDKGKYLEVWRKQPDDSWKVIRHMFSSEIASRSIRRKAAAAALATA